MILLIHNSKTVLEVTDFDEKDVISISEKKPILALFELADKYPKRQLAWCHEFNMDQFNIDYAVNALHHHNMMISYGTKNYMKDEIGYVEDSSYLKVNKDVRYPTWFTSSIAGCIYGKTLSRFKNLVSNSDRFAYSLNSIARIGIKQGLFCYSDPSLVNGETTYEEYMTYNELFRFVSQHYRKRWRYMLFLNLLWYDRRIRLFPLLSTSFQKNRMKEIALDDLLLKADRDLKVSADVLVPTIGRKKYLYQVLKDLASQTLIPKNVIIVEQNPEPNSLTDLDYIVTEKWPFNIIHKFINRTGACNARNLGLEDATSDYLFLADDDILIPKLTLEQVISTMQDNKFDAVTISCLGPEEKETQKRVVQWSSFGSGCSIVKQKCIENLQFDTSFEYGFGEDADFGMQLRNKGFDIAYLPQPTLTHLKAPVGGFRTKFIHPWEKETIQPKPSPTVMLNRLRNTTKQQLLGYKTTLFFKYYKDQSIANPISYYKKFRKQWKQSVYWANELNQQNN